MTKQLPSEPEHAAAEARDRRGLTADLKHAVRREAAAQAALRETLTRPMQPSPEVAHRHRLAPSERVSPFPWGTLEWYRDALAHAQERIRLLESQRDTLLQDKRERDPVLVNVIEAPAKAAAANRGPRASRYAGQHAEWLHAAQQACTDLAGTKAARQRAVTDAVAQVAQDVPRRTLARFVAEHWAEIEGRRAMADRRNLSI